VHGREEFGPRDHARSRPADRIALLTNSVVEDLRAIVTGVRLPHVRLGVFELRVRVCSWVSTSAQHGSVAGQLDLDDAGYIKTLAARLTRISKVSLPRAMCKPRLSPGDHCGRDRLPGQPLTLRLASDHGDPLDRKSELA